LTRRAACGLGYDFRRQSERIVLLMLAAGIGMAPLPSSAQTPTPPAPSPWQSIVPATESAVDADAPEAESSEAATKDTQSKDSQSKDAQSGEAQSREAQDAAVNDRELDWSQLDASTLGASPASKVRVAPRPAAGTDLSWSANDKANGSAAVSVKQSLSNFLDANLLDTRVGADMTVARPPQTLTESQLLANGGSLPQSSGTAWAAITAPGVGSIWNKTAVEARLDPSQEQSKLGTSLSKSLSLDDQHSLSLQDDYSLIEQGIVPVPGIISRPLRNYETDQSAKLSLIDTGTSFTAGQSLSSSDDKWLRHAGAEQKLFGRASISGSIGETLLGTTNKSISAGYKQSW
jgi:hypothetical protein